MKKKIRKMINFNASAEKNRAIEIKNTFSLSIIGHPFLLKDSFCNCDQAMSLKFSSQLKNAQW